MRIYLYIRAKAPSIELRKVYVSRACSASAMQSRQRAAAPLDRIGQIDGKDGNQRNENEINQFDGNRATTRYCCARPCNNVQIINVYKQNS